MKTHVIIMAAGQGTRMRSELPKVLRVVAGSPMIDHVLRAARPIDPAPTVVVGFQAQTVIDHIGEGCRFVRQAEQRGTGHAVRRATEAMDDIADNDSVIVMPGDHPLVTSMTLAKVARARLDSGTVIAITTAKPPDFSGQNAAFDDYGRVVRDARGRIIGIVERRDATEVQKASTEVNVSYYCFQGAWLKHNVTKLESSNAADEFYLTDLVAMAFSQGHPVAAVLLDDAREGLGVNTPEQALLAERV